MHPKDKQEHSAISLPTLRYIRRACRVPFLELSTGKILKSQSKKGKNYLLIFWWWLSRLRLFMSPFICTVFCVCLSFISGIRLLSFLAANKSLLASGHKSSNFFPYNSWHYGLGKCFSNFTSAVKSKSTLLDIFLWKERVLACCFVGKGMGFVYRKQELKHLFLFRAQQIL